MTAPPQGVASLSAPSNAWRLLLARRTIFVSDFSNKTIDDEKQSATITIKYGDGRRGIIVADAHVDDAIVKEIAKAGRQQARRGRRPAST